MNAFEGTFRPVAAIDRRRDPDIELLVDLWNDGAGEALRDMRGGPLAHLVDDLVVVEALPDGHFHYLHYGANVGGGGGLSMQGKTTRDFKISIGELFATTYRQALAVNKPLFAVNKSKASHLTHSWQRLLLPLPSENPQSPGRVVAMVRSMVLVEDILADFALDTGFLGGTLEPIVDGETVVDFSTLSLTDPSNLFAGASITHLSDLFGRALTPDEIDLIVTAQDGSTVLSTELPRSQERFGRSFVLKVSGARMQPLFSITDATELVNARNAADERKAAMEDFATTASDWLWESDPEHRLALVTEAITKESGYTPDHFVGRSRFEAFRGAGNEAVFERHKRDLDARLPFKNLVYQAFAKDGSRRWFRINGKPRFGQDGRFLGYRGTGSNITAEVEALRLVEEQKRSMEDFAEVGSDWLWEVDDDHIITHMSAAIENFTGRPSSYYLGRSRLELIGGDRNADVLPAHLADIKARRGFSNFVYQVQLCSGRTVWARANGKPRFAADGTFLGYRGTGTNITDEVEAREQAARRARDLSEAHKLGRLGAWSYNRATRTVTLSPEYLELVGLPAHRATFSLTRAMTFFCPQSRSDVVASFRRLLRSQTTVSVDIVWTCGQRGNRDLTVIAKSRRDDNGQVVEVYGTVQDITERKRAERELEKLAFHDPLTGLGNRAYFARELDRVLARVSKDRMEAGLLLLDLDHFKEVNDSLGHAAGDELLRRIAERLSMTMQGKGLVYRLGGDEFAVLLPHVQSAAQIASLAGGIISAFAGTVRLMEGAVHISTSIGMVMMPTQTMAAEETMRFADLALYEAKAEGRNRAVLFHAGLDQDVQDRVNIARDLREAVKTDGLDAHFQLQVDVMSGKVAGFEALVRWTHPVHGAVPPAKFIPIAESSRLIADIGSWMVKHVCRQGRAWLDSGGAPLEMAVNLSVAQLWHIDVESDIRNALNETSFPPHLLCVELTESVFNDDAMPRIQRLFDGLKTMGVRIALDDFGTGYSSLKYLNDLSFDKLKIDRSFVMGCDTSPEKMRLLQGIVGLGKGMGLSIVVEGVESEAELQIVCDLGCQLVQGYFFSRPKAFHEACLDAAQIEAEYGFSPVVWKDKIALDADAPFMQKVRTRVAELRGPTAGKAHTVR